MFLSKPTPKLLSLQFYTWHIESTTTAQQIQSCWNIAYEFSIKCHYWKMCEDLTSTPSGFAVWRSPMPWTTDAWCLDFKFFKAEIITQIGRYFYKCLKNSVFWRKNVWLMQNQGLGRHSDDICGERNTPNTPQFIRPIG